MPIRPWALGLASFLALQSPAFADMAMPEPVDQLERARSQFASGAYKAALKTLESYKAHGNDESSRLFWKGRTYAKLKKYAAAVAAVEKARALTPDMLETWYNEACYRALNGEAKAAIAPLVEFFRLLAASDEKKFGAARVRDYARGIETDADLASLRAELAFETARAAALGAARKKDPKSPELAALVDAKAAVCVPDPFKASGSGRCAPKPCPTTHLVVTRVQPVGARDQCVVVPYEI